VTDWPAQATMSTMRAFCAAGLLLLALGVPPGLSGCRHSDEQDNPPGGGSLHVDPNDGPQDGTAKATPGSPGLEPPNTSGDSAAGAASPGVAGSPAAMSGGAGAMMQPEAPAAGSSSSAGSGEFGAVTDAGAGAADAGTDAATAEEVCANAPDCGVLAPCSDSALDCIVVPSCMRAICIESQRACQLECGQTDCALLESFPAQIACQ